MVERAKQIVLEYRQLSVRDTVLGILARGVLAFIVYEATPRDPLVLGGVVVAMALLGLLATRMPAQRALSIDPIDIASRGVNVNCPVQNQIGS